MIRRGSTTDESDVHSVSRASDSLMAIFCSPKVSLSTAVAVTSDVWTVNRASKASSMLEASSSTPSAPELSLPGSSGAVPPSEGNDVEA